MLVHTSVIGFHSHGDCEMKTNVTSSKLIDLDLHLCSAPNGYITNTV